MRQPTKEEKEEQQQLSAKKSSAKKGFEVHYDHHGRPLRLNSSNSKVHNEGLQQYKSTPVKMNPHLNDENAVNSSQMGLRVQITKVEEADPKNEETPLVLPNWVKNPFSELTNLR